MKRNVIQYGLLIALAGSWGAAAADPVKIDVAMVDYRFSPDHLSLEHGVHYRLHLENRGKELHEFTAPTFFAAAKLDNPEAINREHTEVVVQPGESKDVLLTPGAPGAPMTCAATTTNGTAWWAASLSANSHPLGVGCATIAFKGSRGRRKLRREAGAALARLLQDLAGARQQTIITSAKRRKILADRRRGARMR